MPSHNNHNIRIILKDFSSPQIIRHSLLSEKQIFPVATSN